MPAFVLSALVAVAAPARQMIVVCSPGSPGTTADAQPAMDAFAAALSADAAMSMGAVYEPSEQAGVAQLEQSGIGFVSLPFFLAHEADLKLHARLQIVQKGRPALEHWVLVAGSGRVKHADALAGFTIGSSVAFAPAFIRGPVLGAFGALPATAKLVQTAAVLSFLRRAANGEAVAVVLDGPQAASLASLPFASKLEVVARSPALPAGVVVTIDGRMNDKTWSALEAALLGRGAGKKMAAALDGIQISGFVALDDKTLEAARRAYAGASR